MRSKNIVLLEGRINDDFRYKRTKEGMEFCTFTLVMTNSIDRVSGSKNERAGKEVFIRTMVFDAHLLRYLRRVGAKSGNIVSIFGRLNSYFADFRGHQIYQMDVVVRDISIVKTKEEITNKDGE